MVCQLDGDLIQRMPPARRVVRVRMRSMSSPRGEPTASPSSARPLRVAVVGAGPAGIYAAEALRNQDAVPVAVDLIDRLPTPFGLVRHGIAPDHPQMRGIRETLQRTLDDPRVRFVGNVEVGVDISVAELGAHVDAVVYTYGISDDRRLGIEGEQLPGVLAATDFVSWYCGHPDVDRVLVEEALSRARSVIVIGVGNVALDVARMLSRTTEELAGTDAPQHVLDALAASPVEHVTIVGRRGPAQASFTTLELRELGQLAGATVLVEPGDLEMDGGEEHITDRGVVRNLAVLRGWVDHEPVQGTIGLALLFYRRPVHVLGDDRVTGVQVETTTVDNDGRVTGTGELSVLPADLVVRSVGYRAHPLPGLPVDEGSNTVLHTAGRVLRGGVVSTGEYVSGWIKRGPTGVVGTTKRDARETVGSLLEDASSGALATGGPRDDLVQTLVSRGVEPVLLTDWRAIDAAEVALGATRGRARTTLHDRQVLLAAVRSAVAAEPDRPARPPG